MGYDKNYLIYETSRILISEIEMMELPLIEMGSLGRADLGGRIEGDFYLFINIHFSLHNSCRLKTTTKKKQRA